MSKRGASLSVVHRHAGDVGALQLLAHRFGLVAVEHGEAGTNQRLSALRDGLRERVRLVQETLRVVACGLDALLGFRFTLQCADLHDPAGMRDRRLAALSGQRSLLLNRLWWHRLLL